MFKFMKSKKGFTLVELMIVVVIMAILVAVAVPIYNAVTENARKKTCATNRRNIVSQITNNAMGNPALLNSAWTGDEVIFTIETNADGSGYGQVVDCDDFMSDTNFESLFSPDNRPYCPLVGGVLEVTVSAESDVSSVNVSVDCTTEGADHNA